MLSVAASGTEPLSYQWWKNGTNLSGATKTSLTLTNVARCDSGSYSVLVTNVADSVPSSNAVVRVRVAQRLATPLLSGDDGNVTVSSTDVDDGWLTAGDLPNIEVFASTNLVDWLLLTNAPVLTNGQLVLRDTTSTNHPARFYRLVEH